jgi:hypothetical protein
VKFKLIMNWSFEGDSKNSNDYDCIGNCKRLDFIVNFTEIGWGDWIIEPKTFNAYYCSGQCPVPLMLHDLNNDDFDNSPQVTQHAQIMSVLEFLDPIVNIRMTSCVPTKLESLEALTLNDHGEIELRLYENMIVKQCGCR